MKTPMQPFPKGPYTVAKIGDVARILDKNGNDVTMEPCGMQRLVDCANALSTIWFPLNHIPATDAYVTRLEQLRKDAWARVKELEAELASHAPVEAIS